MREKERHVGTTGWPIPVELDARLEKLEATVSSRLGVDEAAAALWDWRPASAEEAACGSWRQYWPSGQPMAHDVSQMVLGTVPGRPAVALQPSAALQTADSPGSYLSHAALLRAASDEVIGAINTLAEIAERSETEQALRERQAHLDARVRQLAAISELGMRALVTEDLQELFDLSAEQLVHGLAVDLTSVLQLQPHEDRLLLRAGAGWHDNVIGRATVSSGPGSQAGYTLSVGHPVIVDELREETRFRPSNLMVECGIVSGLSVLIRGEDSTPFGVLGAHTKALRTFSFHDVHFLQSIANILTAALARKASRDRQSMMTRELSHRVKNMLTVIRVMASETGRRSSAIDDFLPRFAGRLQALSQAHDILTQQDWTGAKLTDLVELALTSHASRIDVDLEEMTLAPSCTQALAMVLHELLTNAMKYGPLSDDQGRISLRGRSTAAAGMNVYRLSWQEHGGPPVSKPKVRGFGSQLVTGMVEHQCGGELRMEWRREGLLVELTFPQGALSRN